MLKLAGEKETLSIINDQHGAPTSAELLADCTAIALREEQRNKAVAGTYHLVASGETTGSITLISFLMSLKLKASPSL